MLNDEINNDIALTSMAWEVVIRASLIYYFL